MFDSCFFHISKVALEYSKKFGTNMIRVLTFEKNRGKGGAVRLGMLSARGRDLLFADADGATKFADLAQLEKSMVELRKKVSKLDLFVLSDFCFSFSLLFISPASVFQI